MLRSKCSRWTRATRTELASATFEWIEGFSNPVRRHSAVGYQSPATCEALTPAALTQPA